MSTSIVDRNTEAMATAESPRALAEAINKAIADAIEANNDQTAGLLDSVVTNGVKAGLGEVKTELLQEFRKTDERIHNFESRVFQEFRKTDERIHNLKGSVWTAVASIGSLLFAALTFMQWFLSG